MTTTKQTYQSLRQKLFLLLVFCGFATNTFAWKPIMIGHRGSRTGVENTKEAFINGIKTHGFKALECDVKVTADKKYICWHDDNIANSIISNRDYDVSIYQNSLASLQSLTLAQSRKNTITSTETSYSGVICTLEEFLQICKDYNVTPIVEIKYNLLNIKSDGSNFSGLSDIYNIIASLDMLDKAVVLGTETMMEYYRDNHPNIQRMWLTNSITDAHIARCQELGCWIDSQPYIYYESDKSANNKAITAAQIKKSQNAGVKVGLWTLNGTSSYNTYGAMGPNFITSDDNVVKNLPELLGTDPNVPTIYKTIYFRPSTTKFTKGYTNHTTKGKNAGWDDVYWAKNGRLTASVHGNLKGSIFLDYAQTKNEVELKEDPSSRFMPINVPTGYTGVIAYRIGSTTENSYINWKNSSGAIGVTDKENEDISNTIPKFTNTVTEIPAPEPIPTDGRNLLCNREGWWDVWYWAYYLPTSNAVTMYFANTGDWENMQLVTGKDIYTHETAPTKTISGTQLSYFALNGKEFGYEYYGFSGNGTTWKDSKTIHVVGGSESNWVYDESSSHTDNKTTTAKNSNANQNRIANRITYATNRTGLRADLLNGANLFIPGAANDAELSRYTINSWQDLNHKQTIIVEEGGKLNYQTTVLNGESSSDSHSGINKTGTVTFDAAYTGNVILRAKPNEGYIFVGFFEEGSNTPMVADAKDLYEETQDGVRTVVYKYKAPNAPRTIVAKFTIKKAVRMQLFDHSTSTWKNWNETENGNTMTINYTSVIDGNSRTYTFTKLETVVERWVTKEGSEPYIFIYDIDHSKPVTLQIDNSNSDYTFIGWWNNGKAYPGKQWILDNPSDYTTYITARFLKTNVQTINMLGEGTISIDYTKPAIIDRVVDYDNGTEDEKKCKTGYYNVSESFSERKIITSMYNTSVTLTAEAMEGYEFVGWYEGETVLSTGTTYTYTANADKTITAKFKSQINRITVSVLNYNTSYNEFREYEYEYNKVTLKQGNNVLKESYSSFSHEFNDATSVTLIASSEEGEDGYDFVGWYQSDTLVSDNATCKMEVIGIQAISARFAPKQCHKLSLMPNSGGTYTVQYGKDKTKYPNNFYSIESSLTDTVIAYVPYNYNYTISSAEPILGYRFKHHDASPLSVNYNDWKNFGKFHSSVLQNDHFVVVSFVRDEEQAVYLDLNGKWKKDDNNTYNYWVFAYDTTRIYTHTTTEQGETKTKQGTFKWIPMTTVTEGSLYTCTLPADTFSHIAFIQLTSTITNPTTHISQYSNQNQTEFFTIPATRMNCMKLQWSYNSSTRKYEDEWTAQPTETGDYRLIYREQTVVDKNTINIDYEFNEGDRIKKITSGTKEDIVSLHIYNKVSDGVNGMNNPEVILQQWNGTEWIDVERRMVFGPLRAIDEDVIRMPGRRNAAATIVYDNGIENIKNDKQDNGSGVWNFVIRQEAGNATILADETRRYEGNYYIRTTNAEGQYNNYTHPANIMTPSEYAKANSDYSHYFIRYVDINEDGTHTSQAGKHDQVKFTIATAYTAFLCKELMIDNNRFSDDQYENDIFVINDNDNPKLPADATVRFGWDCVTNRLTRAYIANTQIKNNEYLVVEGTNIGSPQGDAAYFTDNSNWLYSIDLPNAKAGATAKVKAKMNGQYQFFMGAQPGSQNEYESLISGNGTNTYPIRLLYDFKDDRFTTIYRPESGTITNDVELSTPLMIEREHNDAPIQIQLPTNQKITTIQAGEDQYTQPAYAVMTFLESVLADASKTHHEKMFYWISFPFDVKISDIFGLGDYGKYWIMEEYDGAQRAQSGLAQSNWKYITKKSHVLKKNKGYVLCLNYSQILQDQLFKSYSANEVGKGKLSLYFPSNGVVSPAQIKQQTASVSLEQYENTATAWNHHNWHIIGVPSFANPELQEFTQNDAPFVYQYWHPGDAYAAVSINDVEFYAMHAYMVQYYGNITWTSIVNTTGSVTPKSLAAKTDEQADKKVMLRLELQQAGSTIDKTYVQLRNDKGTKGFDMSLDLTKIINAGANIYSIVDNHEMAGNAVPKEESIIPLGVEISTAGEYTFAMPNGTQGMIVELIDYDRNTSTNLLVYDYTITLPKGTFNQRFALRLKPDKVATSVENIGDEVSADETKDVRKLLLDGVLYLQKGSTLYDAQGHVIR